LTIRTPTRCIRDFLWECAIYYTLLTYLLTPAATPALSDDVPQLCGWHTALWLLSSFRGWRTPACLSSSTTLLNGYEPTD